MNCDIAKESSSRLVDGELGPEDEAVLFAHLGGCADCRAFLAGALRLRRALHADRDALRSDADRAAPAAFPAVAAARRWRAPALAVAAAAACVLLAAGAWLGARFAPPSTHAASPPPATGGGDAAPASGEREPAYVYICTMPEYPVVAGALPAAPAGR